MLVVASDEEDEALRCLQQKLGVKVLGSWVAERTDAELIYSHFLAADLSEVVADGCLPAEASCITSGEIAGRLILQVQSWKNIGENHEHRQEESGHRMLLLSLTDGKELISAFEYRRIPDLELGKLVKGLKLALQCPDVRRGHLLLTSDNTRVLGGGFCTENIVMDVGEESLVLRKRPVPESPSTFPFQPPKISKDGFDVGHISLSSGSSEALDTFSPPSQTLTPGAPGTRRPSHPLGGMQALNYNFIQLCDILKYLGTEQYVEAVVTGLSGTIGIKKKGYDINIYIHDGATHIVVRLGQRLCCDLFGMDACTYRERTKCDPASGNTLAGPAVKKISGMGGVFLLRIPTSSEETPEFVGLIEDR